MSILDSIQTKFKRLQFNTKKQRDFLEDLTSLIADGVPTNLAVETIAEVTEGITKEVAQEIAMHIAEGKLLADGLKDWFSLVIVEIIRTGEKGGALDKALQAANESLGSRVNALGALVGNLAYPLVVICIALGLIVFLRHSVLSSFVEMKPVSQWPSVGQTLYHLGGFVQNWWWLVILIIVGVIFGIARILHSITGDMRKFIDSIPLLSLYKDLAAARFMEALGLLLTNGVTLREALEIMRQEASPYLSWHLFMMEINLSAGKDNVADVLDTQLIKNSFLARLRAIAKGRGFEKALVNLGKRASIQVEKSVALTGRLMGGLLLGVGAFLAMTMVFGVYMIGNSLAH